MSSKVNKHILLLTCDYNVLSVIDFKRCMKLLFREKIRVHKEHDDITLRIGKDQKINLPSIVILTEFKNIYGKIRRTVDLTKKNILIRDGYQCAYCGKHLTQSNGTVDHVMPRSRGGKHTWMNVVSACKPCNNKKDRYTPSEAGMKLLFQPRVPKFREIMLKKYIVDDCYESWKEFLK